MKIKNTSSLLKTFFASLCIISLFSFVSCEVGMGESVDLEAPVLKLKFPVIEQGVTTYLPRTFTLSGTCTDNRGVESVVVNYTYTPPQSKKEITKSANASISGETWQSTITLEDDVDIEITIIAYDARKNTSEDSVASLIACVDAEPPTAKDIKVRKNDSSFPLKEYEEIKNLDEYDSSNKDYFQNEEFSITATLTDNNSIKESYLSLYDADGTIIFDGLTPDITSGKFSPEWKIKGSDLIKINSKYSTGKHYFVPKITTIDGAGNSSATNQTRAIFGQYLCWYPESDMPKILFTKAAGNKISVNMNEKIPINIFDDDGLSEIKYGLYEADTATPTISPSGDLGRDKNIELDTTGKSGNYYLTVCVTDKKSISGYSPVTTKTTIPVFIGNSQKPIIIVEGPTENTSPDLSANKFTLKGYSLDNETVGQNIAIAWLPDGLPTDSDPDKVAKTNAILKKLNTFVTTSPTSPQTDSTTGIKIWKPVITKDSSNTTFAGYVKDDFQIQFDVTTDFKNGSDIVNESKLFLIYIQDATGNITYKTFRLGAYKDSPTIKVEYSSDGTNYHNFENAMMTYTDSGTIYFRVTPLHPKGLAIKDGSLKVKSGTSDVTLTKSGSSYTFNEPVSSGGRLELSFEVEDVLGNKGQDRKTVVISDKSALKSISTDLRKGTTLGGGEVLRIQANFSGNVEVTGEPYILLYNIDGASGDQKAKYKSGSGTDTLIFEYTVLPNTSTDKANEKYVGTPTSDPITLNGGTINGNISGTFKSLDNETDGYKITLDAVSPKLVVSECKPNLNKIATAGASTTRITLAFDENIYIESGTVTVQRTAGWAIPPVLDDTTFKAIYAAVDSDDKITLIGSDSGEPELLPDAATPKGPYKRITHGLDLSGDDAVPDTSTKYVLAFDYDTETSLNISATTGIVKKIRDVLERYGYHKKDFDISECTIDEKNLYIDIPNDWLVDGRQFEVIMEKGCVRDEAGNINEEVPSDKYSFWTDKVAKPWIIVDRYTHGAGVKEPNESGTNGALLTRETAFTTAPTGYARVRILCETPGATIKYGVGEKTIDLPTPRPADTDEGKTENVPLTDETSENVTKITMDKTFSNIFAVGDSSLTKSGKYYIRANATFATASSTQPALTESDDAYEGAYKTVIYSHKPNKTITQAIPIVVQGSDSKGEPLIAGFPMRDANINKRYERVMYKSGTEDYVVISYDIVSTFRMQTYVSNWSKEGDTNCSYGWIIYNNNRNFWDD